MVETGKFLEDSLSFLDVRHENGLKSCKSWSEYIIHAIAIEGKRMEALYPLGGCRETQAMQVKSCQACDCAAGLSRPTRTPSDISLPALQSQKDSRVNQ